MRNGLLTMALLALALQGCGSGETPRAGASAAGSAPPVSAGSAFVAAAGKAAKAGRPAPGVLVVADPTTGAAEAQRLARAGVASLTVPAAGASVTGLRAGLADLRGRPGVDRARVGVLAEGAAAHAAAGLLVREPALAAAALGDVPAAEAARLGRLRGLQLLLQRTKAAGGAAALKRLLLAAPPGTLVHQFDALGAPSRADRDAWIAQRLAAG